MRASPTTEALFFLTVFGVVLYFAWAQGRVHAAEQGAQATSKGRIFGLSFLLGWLGLTGALAYFGWLSNFSLMPPAFGRMAFPALFATIILAWSPFGRRWATHLNWVALIGYQVFRVPVEIWLHWMYAEKIIPVQMTYSGRNFDIIAGLTAPLVAYLCWKQKAPRWLLWAWNILSLGLLLNIVTIALLSMPWRFRVFMNEPANTFITRWPYVWLASLVMAALWGHMLVFHKLVRRSTDQTP
ncbi:MAG: hypothetical protein H6727_18475 [Myxococcales bacterium]|nr:hypothetical protein [Myxococcales bacterium]